MLLLRQAGGHPPANVHLLFFPLRGAGKVPSQRGARPSSGIPSPARIRPRPASREVGGAGGKCPRPTPRIRPQPRPSSPTTPWSAHGTIDRRSPDFPHRLWIYGVPGALHRAGVRAFQQTFRYVQIPANPGRGHRHGGLGVVAGHHLGGHREKKGLRFDGVPEGGGGDLPPEAPRMCRRWRDDMPPEARLVRMRGLWELRGGYAFSAFFRCPMPRSSGAGPPPAGSPPPGPDCGC